MYCMVVVIFRAFPGTSFDLGTKSREIKLPREFNGIFCAGSGNHGLKYFVCAGSGNQRTVFFVRHPAPTVFPGTGCSHDGT